MNLKSFLTIVIALSLFPLHAHSQDLLKKWYDNPDSYTINNWKPFPDATKKESWNQLNPLIKTAIIDQANNYLEFNWGDLSAQLFLNYKEDGIREPYQLITFGRRRALMTLVLAECLTGEGKYLNDIVEGIWKICEETWWGVPAHLDRNLVFPNPDEVYIDLFAAETGATLAWTYYLLNHKFDSITPYLNRKIVQEINERIISPYLKYNHFWWMGFGDRVPNNWNPWINSNVINTVALLPLNEDIKKQVINKSLKSLDTFINGYENDGGCEEGPGYYSHAAGSLFDALLILKQITNGEIDLFNEKLIENMALYIVKMHVRDFNFVNYADTRGTTLHPSGGHLYLFGKMIDNQNLMAFGAMISKQTDVTKECVPAYFNNLRVLNNLFNYNEIQHSKLTYTPYENVWLSDIEVFCTRNQPSGLFLSARGSHNDESHGHNDVGSFVVYKNGFPALIDPGVGEYVANTFNENRYTIWTMQSSYHNLPEVNGIMQKFGKEYKATNVDHSFGPKQSNFSLNLEDAYPDTTGISTYRRSLSLGKNGIMLSDEVVFDKALNNITFNFMCINQPGFVSEELVIPLVNDEKLIIKPLTKGFEVTIERIPCNDSVLKKAWGNEIYRIQIAYSNIEHRDVFKFKMQ